MKVSCFISLIHFRNKNNSLKNILIYACILIVSWFLAQNVVTRCQMLTTNSYMSREVSSTDLLMDIISIVIGQSSNFNLYTRQCRRLSYNSTTNYMLYYCLLLISFLHCSLLLEAYPHKMVNLFDLFITKCGYVIQNLGVKIILYQTVRTLFLFEFRLFYWELQSSPQYCI